MKKWTKRKYYEKQKGLGRSSCILEPFVKGGKWPCRKVRKEFPYQPKKSRNVSMIWTGEAEGIGLN